MHLALGVMSNDTHNKKTLMLMISVIAVVICDTYKILILLLLDA